MKLSINSWLLITIHTVHSIVDLFLRTFLVAYFLNLTGNNIIPASIFYIFSYALSMVGFSLVGPWVKNGKKMILYRVSFVINAILLLLIIYLQSSVTEYIWLLGVILGLEKIFFFFPQNILTSEIASGEQLIKYNGYLQAMSGIARIVMPVVFGWFITKDSFLDTVLFVLGLTILEFILANCLQPPKNKNKHFNVKALLVLAFKKNRVKISLLVEMIRGIAVDIIDILIVLYIVHLFKTNLNLGIFTSIFAICSVLANFLLGKYCRFKSFVPLLAVSSIVTFSATTYFVFDASKLSFIIYNLVFASAGQLIRTIAGVNIYKISQDKSVASLYRAEYLAIREFFLNLGRIIGFSLVILAALSNNQDMLKYLILFLSVLLMLVGYFNIVLCRKLVKNLEKNKC